MAKDEYVPLPAFFTDTQTQPTGELRWVTDDPLSPIPPKLQQCWQVVTYEDDQAIRSHTEWRDVPYVTEEPAQEDEA